jgi:hypothetical protein
MHHMLFAYETGPKRQLSFECSHSKNNSLLCLGKTSMGVTCDVLRSWLSELEFSAAVEFFYD